MRHGALDSRAIYSDKKPQRRAREKNGADDDAEFDLLREHKAGKRRTEVCRKPFTGPRESPGVLLELRGYLVEQETPRAPGVHGLELRVLSSEANQRTELRTWRGRSFNGRRDHDVSA